MSDETKESAVWWETSDDPDALRAALDQSTRKLREAEARVAELEARAKEDGPKECQCHLLDWWDPVPCSYCLRRWKLLEDT